MKKLIIAFFAISIIAVCSSCHRDKCPAFGDSGKINPSNTEVSKKA
jgi:hypothetical protein